MSHQNIERNAFRSRQEDSLEKEMNQDKLRKETIRVREDGGENESAESE
jgi:hypothetical protein